MVKSWKTGGSAITLDGNTGCKIQGAPFTSCTVKEKPGTTISEKVQFSSSQPQTITPASTVATGQWIVDVQVNWATSAGKVGAVSFCFIMQINKPLTSNSGINGGMIIPGNDLNVFLGNSSPSQSSGGFSIGFGESLSPQSSSFFLNLMGGSRRLARDDNEVQTTHNLKDLIKVKLTSSKEGIEDLPVEWTVEDFDG